MPPPRPERRALVTGWRDQIVAVLCDADVPLSTQEVGRRARVIPTGKYAAPSIADREAGDPGQECYRILCSLERAGMVSKSGGGSSLAYWWPTSHLRRAVAAGVDDLDEAWSLPARRAASRNPPLRRRRP